MQSALILLLILFAIAVIFGVNMIHSDMKRQKSRDEYWAERRREKGR